MDNDIKIRLSLLSPDYKSFVESGFAIETATILGSKEEFDDAQVTIFNNAIILFLLFFFNLPELVSFLASECSTSNEKATLLAGAVINLLPENYIGVHTENYNLFATPQKKGVVMPKPTSNIRTMAQDMSASQVEKEVTYTSTQEAILKEGKVVDKTKLQWGNTTN